MKGRRVLVPVDFSLASQRALRLASKLIDEDQSLIALHVVDATGDAPEGVLPQVARHDAELALAQLTMLRARQAMLRRLSRLGHQAVFVEVSAGEPPRRIAAHADSMGADLVVLAAHGDGGWRPASLGSTVESYLRIATRPALIVRKAGASHGDPRR